MTLPSRNAPCPCGSGRKFKHCCLRRYEPAPVAYSAQERQDAFAKLVRFGQRAELAEELRLARLLFWAGRLDAVSTQQRRELEADEHCLIAFLHWFLFDLALDDRATVAARFLTDRGAALTRGERTYLEWTHASCLRPYEVTEVRPDEGLALRDLWTDEVVQVRERLATRQLVRWDILAVRVIAGPDGAPVLDGVPYAYAPDTKEAVLAELRRHHARLRRVLPSDDPVAFFKRVGMVFHHLWLDHVALRPMPTVVTAEGDALTLARVVFDIEDRAKVAAALATHADLAAQDDGSYAWLEATPGASRILGTLVLGSKGLALETTSEPRAERGRRFVENLLGEAVRFRATRYENLEHALARSPRGGREARSAVPPDVEREIVTGFYEQHYRAWLDEPIPALRGRTPRHAARLKTLRPKVVGLIKGLENSMERERRAGRPAADVGWMWEELRLERP